MNNHLIAEFKAEEIQTAIKPMHPIKAPKSFKTRRYACTLTYYWLYVINFYLEYPNGERTLEGVNQTHIVLIPKVKDPKSISVFGLKG